MGAENSFYEQAQFKSDNFVTELLPDKFFLFLLWSEGYNKLEDIDRLVINSVTDSDDSKIYIEFRIGNNSLKEGSFGTYSKTGNNSHYLSYKRLFNKRFTDKNFLKLVSLYDDVTHGKATTEQFETVIKQQVADTFNNLHSHISYFKAGLQSQKFASSETILSETEKEKLIAFYAQLKQAPISPSNLNLLLKSMFYIDAKIDFRNKLLELNYHPEGIGLDDPLKKYRLGKIVLDSFVKYTDVVAAIFYQPIPEKEISFSSKVDYIPLERKLNERGNVSDVLIPLSNSTQDNFSGYSFNGINVQFASSIFAYTIQLVKNKIELLYKLQNSNNYISLELEYGKEISIIENLFYSLDKSANLIFVDENYPDKIVATHNVKVRIFESDGIIRIQTEETAYISMEKYYHRYLKSILNEKINNVLDVFLPVIYERELNLG